MFAAAFVLLVVEVVTPTTVGQWDLDRVLAHLDECKARGVTIAGPYKQDLVELQTLRQVLKSRQEQELHQWQAEPPGLLPYSAAGHDAQLVTQFEGASSRLSMINASDFGLLDPNIILSAVDDLDFGLYDNASSEIGPLEWMF